VRFTCRRCGRTYVVAQELSGLAFRMRCKTCGQAIAVHPAAPAEALAPRDAERLEAAALPVEPPPGKPRHRRVPGPRLHRPTIMLSAILALLVAVYLFLNRDPGAPPARSPATAGARLPER